MVNGRDNGIEIQATLGLRSGVQCQEFDARGIGIQSIVDAGFISAVDIWSFVEQGVQVCFDAWGSLLFLDAATAPRTVKSISALSIDGKHCTTLWSAGSIVVQSVQSDTMSLPAATAQPLPLPSPTPAPQCLAMTTAALNIRDAPDGNRIGGVYPDLTLTVLERDSGWY